MMCKGQNINKPQSITQQVECIFPAGHIDYKEVCIGILKIYDSLNAKFPAHVLSPKR